MNFKALKFNVIKIVVNDSRVVLSRTVFVNQSQLNSCCSDCYSYVYL